MKCASKNLSLRGNGRMILFKIGNDERPAGPKDIKDFKKQLKKCSKKGGHIVCHHAVQVEVIDGTGVLFNLYDRGILTKKELKKRLEA